MLCSKGLRAILLLIISLKCIPTTHVVIPEAPRKEDLEEYIDAIANITNYANENKKDIDLTLVFGTFMSSMHLNHVMKNRDKFIPPAIHRKLYDVAQKLDRIYKIFKIKIREDDFGFIPDRDKLIFTIIENQAFWIGQMPSFTEKFSPPVLRTFSDLKEQFGDYKSYWTNIHHYFKTVPDPKLSDKCILDLVVFLEFNYTATECPLAQECQFMLHNGTNFGYALTHRILALIMARYGLGCSVFSPEFDQKLLRWLCDIAFEECRFVAMHRYQLMDLSMEHAAMCTIPGYSEFFMRHWFEHLLQYQKPTVGCFTYGQRTEKVLRSDMVEKAMCDGHFTSMAAAILGAAVRYIVETEFVKEIDLREEEMHYPDPVA